MLCLPTPLHNPGYPQRLSYVARSNQNKNMTFKYVTAEVGQIFAVTDANRCVFHGLDQHPQMVVIGPLLCPKTLLSSKTSRARLLAPFLEADEAFSHQTAAWIHLGIGSPFPLCVVTTLRRRRPTQKLVFYRQHWKQDLDETLSIPVVNVTRTRKDFQLP